MFYSQKSFQDKLGTCSQNISQAGCLLVSTTNLFPRLIKFNLDPPTLNKVCIKKGIYTNGCMLDCAKLAETYGMTYKKTTTKPKVICIAETNHYAPSYVQHFYMIKPDGTIIDPLDKAEPTWKKNPYNVVSYRVFSAKQTSQQTPVQSEVELAPIHAQVSTLGSSVGVDLNPIEQVTVEAPKTSPDAVSGQPYHIVEPNNMIKLDELPKIEEVSNYSPTETKQTPDLVSIGQVIAENTKPTIMDYLKYFWSLVTKR